MNKYIVSLLIISSLQSSQDYVANKENRNTAEQNLYTSPIKEITLAEQEQAVIKLYSKPNETWNYTISDEGYIEVIKNESLTNNKTEKETTITLSATTRGDTYLTLTNGDQKHKYHVLIFQY
jgi:hypothetical protein